MQAQSLCGLVLIPLMAWATSENGAHLGAHQALLVVTGTLAVQLCLALLPLKLPLAREAFQMLGTGVLSVQQVTETGTRFVFGYLSGGPAPFERSAPQHDFIIAFRVLPVILVLSALARLLYRWGLAAGGGACVRERAPLCHRD